LDAQATGWGKRALTRAGALDATAPLMVELKTRETAASATKFLNAIDDKAKRADCKALAKLMREITGMRAKMWGASIVGFGSYHYVYKSGREGDWFEVGFAPRKRDLTVYIMSGFRRHDALLATLGPHKTGVSCLYLKRLADIDLEVLSELIAASVANTRATYGAA
jgi:hypothetical protein